LKLKPAWQTGLTLVQRLLQHSSAAVTQRYIGIEPQRIEKAIEGHAKLL
jgi:site-specific recombinase XerD